MAFSFRDFTFDHISLDSVSSLFQSGHFTHIELQGSKAFNSLDHNGITTTQEVLSLDFPNQLILSEIPLTIRKTKPFRTNPGIAQNIEEIQRLKAQQEEDFETYISNLEQYNKTKIALMKEQDPVKKELLMIEFSKHKAPREPKDIQSKLDKMDAHIDKLKKQDNLRRSNRPRQPQNIPLTFSGTFTELLINDKSL